MFDMTLWSIVAPALVVSLLVAGMHVPLGLEVIRRGIIFIDLATAQIAGLGAVAATIYFGEAHTFLDTVAINVFAFSAALLAGIFFAWVERRIPQYEEALIGCSFVLAAAMALLLLANQPMGSETVKDLLAGQILWAGWGEIGVIAAVYLPLAVIWFGYRDRIGSLGFYMIFAVTVTASVQVVGVYLVFANLIFPALAVQAFAEKKRLAVAYTVALVGVFIGLVGSVLTDYPTGPMLVWSLALVALIAAIGEARVRAKRQGAS